MAEKVPTINLLPHRDESFLVQFLNWALSIGRLLIIVTEMIALGTFLYRFGLDMQIVDLHDKIKAESFIIDNFRNEPAFRDIHDRLATIKQYTAIGGTTTDIFTDITEMGKDKVTFKDLTVSVQNATIIVEAREASALSQFVDDLKQYPQVTSVTVNKVENKTASAQILVHITATLKQQAFAKQEQQTTDTVDQTILNQ